MNIYYTTLNWVKFIWLKTLLLFGRKLSTEKIPHGLYCYTPDTEKNKGMLAGDVYRIIPCPYYKSLGKELNGCGYLGIVTDDSVFDDQCKICGINTY